MNRNQIFIRSGQAGPYKDSVSVFEFDAKNEVDALAGLKELGYDIKNRLDGVIHDGSCGFPFGLEDFYSLEQIGQGRYRCSITSPYCG